MKVGNHRILYILILFMFFSPNVFSQEKLELENIQPSFETTLESQNSSNEKEISTSKLKSKIPKKISLFETVLISANDEIVNQFLSGKIPYLKIYKILFNLPIKDPSYAFVLAKRKVYEKLSDFKPEMPDGFFWEFNARASKNKFDFFNLDIIHKKRVYGVTRIYSLKNLPLVSYNNFLGMIKIKFFN